MKIVKILIPPVLMCVWSIDLILCTVAINTRSKLIKFKETAIRLWHGAINWIQLNGLKIVITCYWPFTLHMVAYLYRVKYTFGQKCCMMVLLRHLLVSGVNMSYAGQVYRRWVNEFLEKDYTMVSHVIFKDNRCDANMLRLTSDMAVAYMLRLIRNIAVSFAYPKYPNTQKCPKYASHHIIWVHT